MVMGMMGMFIVYLKDCGMMLVDCDFVFLFVVYDIDLGSYMLCVNEMIDFNMWIFNLCVFLGIDLLLVCVGDCVWICFGNLMMMNYLIYLYGYCFEVVGIDGGWILLVVCWLEVMVDVVVG